MGNIIKIAGKAYIIICLSFLILNTFFPLPVSAYEKTLRNSLGMEFVLIPAGTFKMGSPLDEPFRAESEIQHQVAISRPFYMQTTEVTLKQWKAVMGKRLFSYRKGADNMPVASVCWLDCIKFVKKLNALNEGRYRLPTEAEWEYSCRAGSFSTYTWGDTIDCSRAMYANNSLKAKECLDYVKSKGLNTDTRAPVMSYKPNAWGLYDMHGNVWEWCQDWYGDYTVSPIFDPCGPDSGTMKVRRGGSWFKYGHYCRSANRNYGHPASRYDTTGFRLVREVP